MRTCASTTPCIVVRIFSVSELLVDSCVVFKDFYSSKNPPSLKIENFFAEFMDQSLEEALEAFEALEALEFAKQNPIKGLSAQGIKLFVDGSLSQKTAYMSSFKNSKPRLNPSKMLMDSLQK